MKTGQGVALVAAAVATGESPSEGSGEDLSEPVVDLLRANKVPLLDLAVIPEWLARSDAWQMAIAREEHERDLLMYEYREVAMKLVDAGITPVLFKAIGRFPYRSSNLDTLVSPSQMKEATRILEEAGHVLIPNYREDHKALFHRFMAGTSIISVHLHSMVSWGKVPVLTGDDVIGRSIDSGDRISRVASPEDALLITLAHFLYETDQIRLSDLRALRTLGMRDGFDWPIARRRAGEGGWSIAYAAALSLAVALEKTLYPSSVVPRGEQEAAYGTLSRHRWAGRYVGRVERRLSAGPPGELPFSLSKVYSKTHSIQRIVTEPSRTPEERVSDLLATGWNLLANRLRLRCRPAVIVSLSGVDGAGKSTVIEATRAALETCEIPIRVVWSRGGFSRWTEALKRSTRAVLPVPGPADNEAKSRWLSHPMAGTLFSGIVLVEQVSHYLLRIMLPRLFGVTVLCDRYTYDTAADLRAKTRSRPGEWAGDLLVGIVRRPDLPVVLRLSAEAAAERKPGDAPAERLALQVKEMDDLSERYGLYVVEADRADDQVIDEIVRCSLTTAFHSFEGKKP